MRDTREVHAFYEQAYAHAGADALRYGHWRALGAVGKADHVLALCGRAGVLPAATLDVGCGDGALLGELARRGFGGRLAGLEISEAAVAIAAARSDIDSVARYDGTRVPAEDRAYDLGILSHVLEHVQEPASLLAEVARACRHVVVEVPLEANVSARRARKQRVAQDVGHVQRLDRAAMRAIVTAAGLEIEDELEDALPLRVQLFWATTPVARARAGVKWALRSASHRLAPALARRLFSVHYACLCSAP